MKLNYKTYGNGEPLIILHGLMGSLDNWSSPAKNLAEFYQVYTLDQRNHGKSTHSNELTYDLMMKDLLNFMDLHQLEKANVLGHSMGGKTAMKFAQNFPERVNKLIIADIGPKAYPVHHERILEGLTAINLKIINNRKEAETILSDYVEEKSARQFLLKNLFWIEKGRLEWRFNLNSISKNIGRIGVEINDSIYNGPTLFMRGGMSKYIEDVDEDFIFSVFPNSDIITIDNAGHWLHAEQPENFTNVVLRFLIG